VIEINKATEIIKRCSCFIMIGREIVVPHSAM